MVDVERSKLESGLTLLLLSMGRSAHWPLRIADVREQERAAFGDRPQFVQQFGGLSREGDNMRALHLHPMGADTPQVSRKFIPASAA